MIAALLLMLAQAAPAPERFSILVDPCASANDAKGNDVVVCGRTDKIDPRMPLRDDRGPPDHAVPSNPQMSAAHAMSLEATPCAAVQRGCTIGFGPPVMPTIAAAAGLVKTMLARHPDKAGRMPIDLSDAPPATSHAITP